MPGARVTMKDVARASGVSPATVSFVLNDRPGQTIPPATRDRVHAAAAELGYVPHGVARALREGSSRIVVLKVARLPHGGAALTSFIDGLDAELARLGHTLLVRYGSDPDGDARLVAAISPRAVLDLDALYFGDERADAADAPFSEPGSQPRPVVPEGGWTDGMAAHTATQVRYLAERGHRSIAMAVAIDPAVARLVDLRLDYARHVARELGLGTVPVLEFGGASAPDGPLRDASAPDGPLRDASAADAVALQQLLGAHPEVTAVAASDDASAIRVLAAAAAIGLDVPGRLAVIGFDDAGVGAHWSPRLTTVRIDAAAYGRRAARALLGVPAVDVAPQPAVVVRRESA